MSDLLWKHLHGTIKQIDRSKREITALLTHQVVDADGEVVMADGVDWGRWRYNAPMELNHDRERKIGNWDPASLRRVMLDGAPGWTAKGRLFSTGGLADQVYTELQEGAMGVSIGFRSLRADDAKVAPGQTGKTHHAIEVVEASLVTLQSCPTCVVLEKSARGTGECEALTVRDDGDERIELADAIAAMHLLRERQARGLLGRGDQPVVFLLEEDEPDTEEATYLVDPDEVKAVTEAYVKRMVDHQVRAAVNFLGRVD